LSRKKERRSLIHIGGNMYVLIYLYRRGLADVKGKHGDQGPSGAGLDKEEGLTMRHVHGHEPAIEWYDPLGKFCR
jgi:hypothetical protein